MGLQSGLLGLVSLIIIISVTFYGINQVKHLQYDYQDKMKDIASQVNAAQKYQARMDRKNQMNMGKSSEIIQSIAGGYAAKSALVEKVATDKIQVADKIRADAYTTELNGSILMTAAASKYTSQDNKNAEISNDLGVNKHLMIMGNSSGGTADRRIGILNKLDVNGTLEVDLDSSSTEVKGRDLVSVGDSSAWMRKDGYVFGKNMIDGRNVMGETLRTGGAKFEKDGTLRAGGVVAFGQMAGGQVTGRKTVSVGASELNDLGDMKGRQLCIDGVCLLATDLNYMKKNSNPKDCLVGEWTDWGGCSKPCGGGRQFRWRNVLRPSEFDGIACPNLSEMKDCNLGACLTQQQSFLPVDCVLSDWSSWSQCSKTCGGGIQTRERSILQPSENAGVACPTTAELRQQRSCNPDACPPPPVTQDCVLSAWGDYSACTAPCGGGIKTKTRSIIQIAANGGLACPPESDLRFDADCNTQPCVMSKLIVAVNVEMSLIQFKNLPSISTTGEWFVVFTTVNNAGTLMRVGATNVTKRVGGSLLSGGVGFTNLSQWNSQRVFFDAAYVFKTVELWSVNPSTGALIDVPFSSFTLTVDNFDVGVDCALNWSTWGSCSVTCGGGERTRTATVIKTGSGIGLACPATLTEKETCNPQPCVMSKLVVTVNVEMSLIQFKNLPSITTSGEWFAVFMTVNNAGTLMRVGATNVTKRVGGSLLSGGVGFTNLNQWNSQRVFFDAAYVFKSVEFWSANASTGALIDVPFTSFVLSADNFDVGVDCVLNWSAWGSCSVSCGGGERTRTATIVKNGSGIGTACPVTLTEKETCNPQACNTNYFTYTINKNFSLIQFTGLPSITTTAEWYIVFSNSNGNNGTLTKVGTTSVTKRVNGTYGISAGMGFTNLNQWNGQTAYFDAAYTFYSVEFWSYSPSEGFVPIPLNTTTLSAANFITDFNCVYTWSAWSSCIGSCGTGNGTQTRTAMITTPGSGTGTACPADQSQPCTKTCTLSVSATLSMDVGINIGGYFWYILPQNDDSGAPLTWTYSTTSCPNAISWPTVYNNRYFAVYFNNNSVCTMTFTVSSPGYTNLTKSLTINANVFNRYDSLGSATRSCGNPSSGAALGRFSYSSPISVKYFSVSGFPNTAPTAIAVSLNANNPMGSTQYPYLYLYDSAGNVIGTANPCQDYTGLPSTYATFFNRVFVVNPNKMIGILQTTIPTNPIQNVSSVQFVWVSTYSNPLDINYLWNPQISCGSIDCYPYQ